VRKLCKSTPYFCRPELTSTAATNKNKGNGAGSSGGSGGDRPIGARRFVPSFVARLRTLLRKWVIKLFLYVFTAQCY